MPNPESTLENETYKMLSDAEIKMDVLISTTRKISFRIVDIAVPANHRNESKTYT